MKKELSTLLVLIAPLASSQAPESVASTITSFQYSMTILIIGVLLVIAGLQAMQLKILKELIQEQRKAEKRAGKKTRPARKKKK